MAKVPKIQCSTILRMVFFSKNKALVTKKAVVKNDNHVRHIMAHDSTC